MPASLRGTCEECPLIAAGEHPDVCELDAASNTGVDNVREEIINRVSYAPVRGSYKVYIIDEVHMLTPAAFNALLKTLEEPPEHVVFVMCTTDPQKVLETILSRVQRFDFRPISNDELLGRLEYVCQQEGFSYDREALELVMLHARGGMRDALSDLERLATYTGGAITLDAAQDLLGEVPASTLSEVALALASRDVPRLFSEIAGLVESGRDLLQFARELAGHLRALPRRHGHLAQSTASPGPWVCSVRRRARCARPPTSGSFSSLPSPASPVPKARSRSTRLPRGWLSSRVALHASSSPGCRRPPRLPRQRRSRRRWRLAPLPPQHPQRLRREGLLPHQRLPRLRPHRSLR